MVNRLYAKSALLLAPAARPCGSSYIDHGKVAHIPFRKTCNDGGRRLIRLPLRYLNASSGWIARKYALDGSAEVVPDPDILCKHQGQSW